MDPDLAISCIYTEPIEREIKIAFSNSFGFGGHNSSVVFAAV